MKRILVVDDIAENRYLLEAMLRAYGYEVISACDGLEALNSALRQPPDLVISDILMPVMDGFALCRRWRAESTLRGIPFIFYTATYTDARDEQLAMDLGADRFVIKPQEPQVMHAIVQDVLARGTRHSADSVESTRQADEIGTLREYNEVLVRKLEKKVAELESTREALEQDIRVRHQVEADLRRSNEHWKLIFDTEPECEKIVSAACTLEAMNPAGLAMIDAPSLDLVLGQPLLDLVVPEHRAAYFAMHREALSGRSRRFVFEIIGLKGVRRWLDTYQTRLPNADGTISLLGITRDITEQRRAETAVVESEQRFRELFESSADAIFVEDFQGQVLNANPAACRLHGLSRQELLSKNVRELIPEQHRAVIDRDFPKLVSGELTKIEGYSLHVDGTVVPVELRVSHVVHGGQLALLLHVRDITERKQSEALVNGQKLVLELVASGKPLAESLTALLNVVEAQSADMLSSILLLDADGLHLRHGAAPSLPAEYCRAVDGVAIGPGVGSCGTAAFQGEPVIVADIAADPLWADYRDLALRHGLRACWSTPIFGKTRRVLGTFAMYYHQPARPNEHQLRLIDMATHTAAIAISKHQEEAALHATQAALQASEERLFKLFRNSPDAAAVVSLPEGRLIDVNDQFVELTGYSRAEVLSHTTLELGLWANSAEREMFHHFVCAPVGTRLFDATIRSKSGELREMQFSSDMIELDGRTCAITTARDVTAQKRAEQALRESQARLRLSVQAANIGLWDWNLLTNENYFSPEWKRMLGYADHEIPHRFEEWESRLHPDDRPRTLAAVNDFLTGRRPDYDVEFRMRHQDGSWRWILSHADLIRDTSGKPERMLGCHVDINHRKQANEELTASRTRLEILSRELIAAQESERRHLALELHDEIGQALTGIKLNLRALQQQEQSPKSSALVQETIGVVDQTLQQTRSLSLDLRPSILDDIGLVAALRWCLDRQSQRASYDPQFVADSAVSGTSPEINTACFRIVQESLTNIARHAKARHVRVEIRQDDQELELLVRDDGIGFDVATARSRTAHGESLGMLGMEERVRLIGGQIEFVSVPTQGTTIRVRIPLAGDRS